MPWSWNVYGYMDLLGEMYETVAIIRIWDYEIHSNMGIGCSYIAQTVAYMFISAIVREKEVSIVLFIIASDYVDFSDNLSTCFQTI